MFGAVPLLQIPSTATQTAVSPRQLSSGNSSNPDADLPVELHAVLEPAVASAAVMSSQVNLFCCFIGTGVLPVKIQGNPLQRLVQRGLFACIAAATPGPAALLNAL